MQSRGFTLIELLVVIAIIGILSSVVLTSLNRARSQARDTRRVAEMRSIITALELYRLKYDKMPCFGNPSIPTSDNDSSPNFLQPLVDEGFLPDNPHDPSTLRYFYVSLHKTAGGSCGQLVELGFDAENKNARCPGQMVNPPDFTHCHIYYPELLPCAVANGNPYNAGAIPACTSYIDNTNGVYQ